VSLTGETDDLNLKDPLATAVYRMVQEALTNVARHSGARSVDVHMDVQAERLRISVRDDGRGLRPDPNRKSFGLVGIRERARTLGGSARIHSPESGGTVVEIEVPVALYSTAGAAS
jgi:signal transduction histidine kinase